MLFLCKLVIQKKDNSYSDNCIRCVGFPGCLAVSFCVVNQRFGTASVQMCPGAQLSFLYSGDRVCIPGVKFTGRGVDHPLPSVSEVKERVEIDLYDLSGTSWSIPG
jgi:hypothetical protein